MPSPQAAKWAADPDFHSFQKPLRVGSEIIYRKIQKVEGVEVESSLLTQIDRRSPVGPTLPNQTVFVAQQKLISPLPLLPRAELLLYRANQKRIFKEAKASLEDEGLVADDDGELVITERNGKHTPEFRLSVTHPKTGEFFVDHYNIRGERLERKAVSLHFQDSARFAQVFPMGPKKSELSWVPVFVQQVAPTLSNAQFSLTSRSGQTLNSAADRMSFALDDVRFDQIQVYYYIESFLNAMKVRHGFELPLPLRVETHIGYPESSNAAFYHQRTLRFGTGDSKVYQDMMRDPTIVIHEVGHAVVDALTRLSVEGEAGSINEAFADFFAASFLNTPNMGEDSFLQGAFRRSLVNTKAFDERAGKTYADSEIISGFFWSLRDVWGAAKTEEFSLRLLARLLPNTDFETLRNQMRELSMNLPAKDRQELETLMSERKWL